MKMIKYPISYLVVFTSERAPSELNYLDLPLCYEWPTYDQALSYFDKVRSSLQSQGILFSASIFELVATTHSSPASQPLMRPITEIVVS